MIGEEVRKPSTVYEALSHPMRKRVLELLGERDKIGFKDLKAELKTSTGTLYYHLDSLGDLITQDEDRKYILTQKGKRIYDLVGRSDGQIRSALESVEEAYSTLRSRAVRTFMNIFLAKSLFLRVSEKPLTLLPAAFFILAFGSWISVQAQVDPILMFLNYRPILHTGIFSIPFFLSWIAVYLICDLLSSLIFKRPYASLPLLVGTAFAYLPLIVFVVILYTITKVVSVSISYLTGLLLVLNMWSVGMLTSSVSLSKGLRTDRAALVSLSVMYVNLDIFLLSFFGITF